MNNNAEQVNKLREYIKKTKADNYPIEGHLLEKESDYSKNLYFRMLCMVLQYSGDIVEEQTMLLQRLIKGCKAEHTVQDYMRQSFEIGETDYKEFIEYLLEKKLSYVFALDVLLISFLKGYNEKQSLFIVEIMETCKVDIDELAFLSKFVSSILEQRLEIYLNIQGQRPKMIDSSMFMCYIDVNRLYMIYCNKYDRPLQIDCYDKTLVEDEERNHLYVFGLNRINKHTYDGELTRIVRAYCGKIDLAMMGKKLIRHLLLVNAVDVLDKTLRQLEMSLDELTYILFAVDKGVLEDRVRKEILSVLINSVINEHPCKIDINKVVVQKFLSEENGLDVESLFPYTNHTKFSSIDATINMCMTTFCLDKKLKFKEK